MRQTANLVEGYSPAVTTAGSPYRAAGGPDGIASQTREGCNPRIENVMPSSPRRLEPYLWLGLLLGLVWAFWPTLVDMTDRWWTDSKYSHGYFVPLFSLWLLWRGYRRAGKSIEQYTQTASWWGLPIIAAGLALYLSGAFFFIDLLSELALLPTLAGLCICLGGWSFLGVAGWAIAFLAFMLPLPYQAEVLLAHPLQRVATEASTFLLQMVGVTASAEGNIIVLNSRKLNVEEACNGLGMLVTFFALAAAVALAVKRPWLDKVLILVSAIPVALLANILRITITGILSETVGGETAMLFYHDLAGYFMMTLALVLIWVELKIWSRLLIEVPEETTESIGHGLGFGPAPAPAAPPAPKKSHIVL